MSYYVDNSLPPIVPVEKLAPIDQQAPAETKPVRIITSAVAPPQPPKNPNAKPLAPLHAILQHPDIGDRVTICVLFYGGPEYFQLHEKCLNAILRTVPREAAEIRVGSNALNSQSRQMIDGHVATGRILKHYAHAENLYKYPVMREMFHDPDLPLSTKWVIWFDDDSIADRDPNWLSVLASSIVSSHRPQHAHLFGNKLVQPLTGGQQKLFASRPWHKGKHWCMADGKPVGNGNKTMFVAGGFWAMSTEAIIKADIPDLGTGLTNNGGDWQIGAQLWQNGFGMQRFNQSKQYVHTSSVKRRGATMPVPGTAPLPIPKPVPLVQAMSPQPILEQAPRPASVLPRHIVMEL